MPKKGEHAITALFVVLIVSLIVTILALSRHVHERNDIIYSSLRERLRLHCSLITEMVLAGKFGAVQTLDDIMDTASVENGLREYAKNDNLKYIYFMKYTEKDGEPGATYVLDTDESPDRDGSEDFFPLEDSPNLKKAFGGEYVCSELGVYDPGWKGLISAFYPIYDSQGAMWGVLGVDMSDTIIINTRKNIQNTLNFSMVEIVALVLISLIIIMMYSRKATSAERASTAKTQFLSTMSHELRTPLTALIGMLDMLEKSNDLERIKGYYAVKMKIASNNLLQNINDILDMSKIETGKMNLTHNRFDIEDMFRSILDVMEIAAHEKGISMHVNLQPGMKRFFMGDLKRLSQIYMNLLSNAVKFTKDNGTITVDVEFRELEDGHAELISKVADNGIGIPKNKISKLFQNFSQIDNSLSRKYTGSGLGLVIVKNIVGLMGGEIKVESEEGVGTVFSFNVILEVDGDQGVTEISPHFFDVLLIDDQEDVCKYVSSLLEARGIKIMTAVSGPGAVELVKREKLAGHEFNVILVDYMMPEINGIETIKALRGHIESGALIMMVSSIDWSLIEEEAKEAGITNFLQKPLLPSALIDAMNEVFVKRIVRAKNSAEKKYDFTGKTILLVEDNETNREIAQFTLEDTNVACVEAEDGEMGVKLYNEAPEKYDLILMDIQMPRMDGFEATKRIRESGRPNAGAIPIIAMTANVFTDQIEEALNSGMSAHLGKPLDAREMKELLAKYLDKAPA